MFIKPKDHTCLLSILDAINKVDLYTNEHETPDTLFKDIKSFDAVLMNFVVIGEMVEKLSGDFKQYTAHVDWANIKGFRNIIAHDYFGVDAEEVWQICRNDLANLKNVINKIL